jgi:hypothetical protein
MTELSKLIYDYRMMGFDDPHILYNYKQNYWSIEISDPAGPWRRVKGSTQEECVIKAIKWARRNWHYVEYKRMRLFQSYGKWYRLSGSNGKGNKKSKRVKPRAK